MTQRPRPRSAIRRDVPTRTIDSSAVHYPGLDYPAAADEYASWRESGRQLRPARDTGLAIEGRLARERRRRERLRTRLIGGITVVVLAVVITAAAFWRQESDARAASSPAVGQSTTSTPTPAAHRTASDPGVAQMRAADPAAHPTPLFARYGNLQLHVPVRPADLTEIGFHQASYGYALHMRSLLPRADSEKVRKERTTHRDLSKQDDSPGAVLTGSVLTMWRDRPGKPDTAADVGAEPGSTVYSPVNGTVVKLKRYKLYGLHDDYELHIQPRGHSKLDLVMIHIANVTVSPGDDVIGGITKVGEVRRLSDKETLQLGEFTRGGGNHTHMQLNDATDPAYKGLRGAIKVKN